MVPHFVDAYAPAEMKDFTRESATVLAQGLDNGAHTLELRAAGLLPIAAIRVYQPPLR